MQGQENARAPAKYRLATDGPQDGVASVARWTPELLEEIRRRCDIVEIIAQYVHLKRVGRGLVGRCPFHDDRTPSFSVSPDRQVFYCFGCHAAGDVFAFVMKKEGLDFPEAVASLARRAGVRLPEGREEGRRRGEREEILRALAAAAAYFARVLEGDPAAEEARRYLGRRCVGEEARRRFGLGYAPPRGDALVRELAGVGFPIAVLVRAGLAAVDGDGRPRDRFRGRVMFPIRDEQGRVVAFGGRSLGDEQPKYLNSPETPVFVKRQTWYGLDVARPAVRESGRALVMEGYMDVVTAHQHGFTEAVASLGTSLSQEQAWSLARHAREVVLAYDADAAGGLAALRGIEAFRRAGCLVRVARLPEGEDPDAFLRARGAEAFRSVIAGAAPLLEYVFEEAVRRSDPGSVEGKVAVVRAVLPHLAAEESAVARDAYLARFAARLGIAEEALRQELTKYIRSASRGVVTGRPGEYNKKNARQTTSGFSLPWDAAQQGVAGSRGIERHLLRLLLRHPELRPRAREAITPQDFEDEAYRRLAARILEPDQWVGPGEDGGAALAAFGGDDPELRELVAALLMEGQGGERSERELADCLARLQRRRLERRIASLTREIEALAARGQPIPRQLGQELQEAQRQAARALPLPREIGS